MEIKLDNQCLLRFFACDQGMQFYLEKGGEPYVCRKASLREVRRLVARDTEQVFKGRLQLRLANDTVTVIAKNESVGTIPVQTLRDAIEAAASDELPENATTP